MAYPFEAIENNPSQLKSPKASKCTGNRCGHDPDSPRLISVLNPFASTLEWAADHRDSLGHKRKSAWFYEVTEILNRFYTFPKTIPALGYLYKGIKDRKHRTEAREADVAVLSFAVHHIELASSNFEAGFSRVGMTTREGFQYYDTKFWCEKTGLTPSRLKRSIKRLSDAGVLVRERRWIEREGGRFKALATMTLINHAFFNMIGMLEGLRETAKFAYEKLKKDAAAIGVAVSRMLKCAVDRTQRQPKAIEKKVVESTANDFPPEDARHWSSKLPKPQQDLFRQEYLRILLEEGAPASNAELYRRAYTHIISRF